MKYDRSYFVHQDFERKPTLAFLGPALFTPGLPTTQSRVPESPALHLPEQRSLSNPERAEASKGSDKQEAGGLKIKPTRTQPGMEAPDGPIL